MEECWPKNTLLNVKSAIMGVFKNCDTQKPLVSTLSYWLVLDYVWAHLK